MNTQPNRIIVNLARYPDLVVIYLGMRVNALAGVKTLLGFGPKIAKSVEAKPDGLLLHEPILYSLRHVGMRQYWRDFDALEKWSRSEPHKLWWQQYLKDTGGTGFWHETYLKRGGMEAVYINMEAPTGFARFAPTQAARGSMFSARRRAGVAGEAAAGAPVREDELYRAAG